MLLGGDFYDLVEAADGWVHAVVGDVCGRGPEEAALGVCLRVAWRTMVLAGRPMADVLSAVQQVLEHERHEDRMFATLCMISIAPDRSHGRLHLAGHPQPLLISPGGVRELGAPVCPPPGIAHARDWPTSDVALGDGWSLAHLHRRADRGPDRRRAGAAGQRRADRTSSRGILRSYAGPASRRNASSATTGSSTWLVGHVRELNGGDLDDDLAVLALGFPILAGG